MFYGGLTYSSHPVSLAASLATIGVYEEDGLIDNAARLDPVMREHHRRLAARHPSVGATRNLGLFGIIDLVRSRDPWTPLTPFNGTSDEMKAIGKFLRENGLYTMIPNNSIHTNPPLCITEDQLAEGFEIIDRALDIADAGGHLTPGADRIGRPPMTTASGSLPRPAVASIGGPVDRRSRRRRTSASRSSSSALLLIWEGAKWLGGDPWRLHGTIAGIADRLRARPAAHVADRRRPVAAARLGHRPGLRRPRPARRRAARRRARRPGRCSRSAEAFAGFVLGGAARARPRDPVRPLEARRTRVRPVRRRVADRADPGHRAARRRRASRPTGCR